MLVIFDDETAKVHSSSDELEELCVCCCAMYTFVLTIFRKIFPTSTNFCEMIELSASFTSFAFRRTEIFMPFLNSLPQFGIDFVLVHVKEVLLSFSFVISFVCHANE